MCVYKYVIFLSLGYKPGYFFSEKHGNTCVQCLVGYYGIDCNENVNLDKPKGKTLFLTLKIVGILPFLFLVCPRTVVRKTYHRIIDL